MSTGKRTRVGNTRENISEVRRPQLRLENCVSSMQNICNFFITSTCKEIKLCIVNGTSCLHNQLRMFLPGLRSTNCTALGDRSAPRQSRAAFPSGYNPCDMNNCMIETYVTAKECGVIPVTRPNISYL